MGRSDGGPRRRPVHGVRHSGAGSAHAAALGASESQAQVRRRRLGGLDGREPNAVRLDQVGV